MPKEKSESMMRWEGAPGFIYFIGAGALEQPKAIKIGISTQRDIRRRFSTIQGGNHEQLFLLGIIPFDSGDKPMLDAWRRERQLHKQFAHLQHAEDGWAGAEWFSPTQEIVEFMEANAVRPKEMNLPISIYRPNKKRSSKAL